MTGKPVNLTAALASFDEVYSPRIVARMNDYDVRVAHARGDHVWHVHEDTDEFFLVLMDGLMWRPGMPTAGRPSSSSNRATRTLCRKVLSTGRPRRGARS
jgi:hypothetical protein